MRPNRRRPRLTLEHLLLLGALALFAAGALWLASDAGRPRAGRVSAGLGGLPNLGLPLIRALAGR